MAFAETFKALSDPVRRRILELLKNERLSAGEIGSHFDMTGATISYHLGILKKADLVLESREKNFKLATTSSTGGLLLALQRAIVTARPKGRYRKHFCWPAIKRYYSNLLVSILLLALLYTFELLHLLYCQSFQHNIL